MGSAVGLVVVTGAGALVVLLVVAGAAPISTKFDEVVVNWLTGAWTVGWPTPGMVQQFSMKGYMELNVELLASHASSPVGRGSSA